jgi:hypothetical protein
MVKSIWKRENTALFLVKMGQNFDTEISQVIENMAFN